MSFAFGRSILSIPGPSIIPDRVLNAMHKTPPNIYEGEIVDLTARIKRDLQAVARTKGDALIYISNGHGAWEAALSNVIPKSGKLLFLATGRFALGWAEMATKMGADVEVLDFGIEAAVDPDRLEARLREDRTHEIKAILVCQTDTASSVRNDVALIRQAIDAAGHPALFLVDCIASLACEPYEMDAWGVDVTVSGCQKGLMTPPGLAFNHISDKAFDFSQSHANATGYWDWSRRKYPNVYYMNFYGTAPTQHLFGLGEALDILLREEGIEAAWTRHKVLAEAVWAAIETWGEDGPLRPNITDRANRSIAVTTVRTGDADADAIRQWCAEKAGLTLGIGLDMEGPDGEASGPIFRIGHMGHLSPPMILGTLATIDAALKALDIPHGRGAIDRAAAIIAAAA